MKARLVILCGVVLTLAGCTRHHDDAWSGYVEGDYVYVGTPIGGLKVLP